MIFFSFILGFVKGISCSKSKSYSQHMQFFSMKVLFKGGIKVHRKEVCATGNDIPAAQNIQ